MFRSLRLSFEGEVEASPFVRRCYSVAAGIYAQRPRAVAFPSTGDDVRAAVELCRARKLPLTARGAGSGMAGNNVGRGLVLDFTRHLNRIRTFDPGSGEVVVEPGVTYDGLNELLRAHGRFLPPNPSSGAFCTLGGMVASNASGMRSVKYGSVAPWLVAARGVWGTGDPFELRRPHAGAPAVDRVLARLEALFRDSLPQPPPWLTRVVKNSSGLRVWPAWDGRCLDGVELLVASEGTLAIFTELTFRTAALPGQRALLLAAFPTLDALAEAVECLRPLDPSGLEFLDATFLEPLREGSPAARKALPSGAEAVLFVELEAETPHTAAAAAREALGRIAGLALPGARLAGNAREARVLWSLRRGASPSLGRRHPRRVPLQFVEDCAVPPGRLAELLRGLRRIFAAEGVPAALFGHAGEFHVHANPLLEPDDPLLPARIERVAGEVCDLVERLGGTLSGEHGDGLARAEFAARRFGAGADFFAVVKRVCDPDGILNPGKILPREGWTTGSDLRHPWERRALAARRRWRLGGRAPLKQSGPGRGRRG